MQGMWSPEILQLPSCMIQTGQGDSIVWNGPRVRMGLSEGQPVRVTPHTTSGRADYFGPVVNRCLLPSVGFMLLAWTVQGCRSYVLVVMVGRTACCC